MLSGWASVRSGAAREEVASAIPAWRELFTGGLARTTLGLLLMEAGCGAGAGHRRGAACGGLRPWRGALTVAALVVTCGVLSWTVGTWAQSWLADRWPIARIATFGEALMLLGVGGVISGVGLGVSIVVYVAWALAALGMGMTYPAIGVLATEVASSGDEVTTLAQYQLGDVLGSAFGPALVGIAVTATASRSVDLREGLMIGFSATERDRARRPLRLDPAADNLQHPLRAATTTHRSRGPGILLSCIRCQA